MVAFCMYGCGKKSEKQNEASSTKEETSQTQTVEVVEDEIYLPKEYVEHNGKQYGIVALEADKISYHTFEELEKNSAYIVVGEFVNDETSVVQRGTLPQSSQTGVHVLDWYCYNQFKVFEVLKGELSDEVIEITGTYAYDDEEDRLYRTENDMYPMNKGGRYLYFLRERGTDGRFCPCGEPSGRYPYMKIDSEKLEKNEYTKDDLGVDNIDVFKYQLYPIYQKIVENYQIDFE